MLGANCELHWEGTVLHSFAVRWLTEEDDNCFIGIWTVCWFQTRHEWFVPSVLALRSRDGLYSANLLTMAVHRPFVTRAKPATLVALWVRAT